MLTMPRTSAPSSRRASTTSRALPPVEIRSSTTTTLAPSPSGLDAVVASVAFRLGAHVAHGQVQDGGGDGGMGDAGGGGAHEHLAFRPVLAHEGGESVLHLLPYGGSREGEAVVAVDRAFYAACPGERLFGAQEHCPRLTGAPWLCSSACRCVAYYWIFYSPMNSFTQRL